MKRIIILLIALFTLTSYSQSNNIVSIDSTQVRLIGNKLYIAHQGFEKKNGVVNSTFWYSEVDLGNVLFKTSKSEFLPESYSTLNALVILLRDNSQFILKVDGHTDKVGNSIKNLKLSVKRAKAVKKYLFKKGIKLDRVVAKGYGDKFPVCEAPCNDNRRVEFALVQDGTEQKLVTRLKEKKALAERNRLTKTKR